MTDASLQILTGEASGHETDLCGSHRMTNRFSVRLHCDHLGWTRPSSSCGLSDASGKRGYSSRPWAGRPLPAGRGDGVPGDWEMARILARFAGRLAAHGLRPGAPPGPVDPGLLVPRAVGRPPARSVRPRPLVPPRDRFWADPFPIDVGGRTYIFVEEYPYRTRKGHIAVIEIDERGQVSGHRKVLERDYHLSYPLVFPYRGTLYMIPETTANRTVELYRCMEFPHRSALDRVLLNDVRRGRDAGRA